jgi:hypothetical protein
VGGVPKGGDGSDAWSVSDRRWQCTRVNECGQRTGARSTRPLSNPWLLSAQHAITSQCRTASLPSQQSEGNIESVAARIPARASLVRARASPDGPPRRAAGHQNLEKGSHDAQQFSGLRNSHGAPHGSARNARGCALRYGARGSVRRARLGASRARAMGASRARLGRANDGHAAAVPAAIPLRPSPFPSLRARARA